MNVTDIAKICHEANKTLCETQGDTSQVSWAEAPIWQRDSAEIGVAFCLNNPDAPASANHESWLKQKEDEGWKYGPVKDADKKEHPCFVSYDELPPEQKVKDHLFKAIVGACAPFYEQKATDLCECGHARNDHDLIDARSRLRADCLAGVFRGSEINAAICPCSWFNLAEPEKRAARKHQMKKLTEDVRGNLF